MFEREAPEPVQELTKEEKLDAVVKEMVFWIMQNLQRVPESFFWDKFPFKAIDYSKY